MHTRILLDRLGSPEQNLPPVIHVAGTNGKGSTIAFLQAILQEAGYKVHSYTSPHLLHFNERITLDGEHISDNSLHMILERCRDVAGDMQPGFFSATTAAAFLAFSESPADILLVETGCGGCSDPTNLIEDKLLTIITTISYDHMEILGESLGKIAYEKAGIMRGNTPCVVSFQQGEALAVLEREAEKIGSPLYQFRKNWVIQRNSEGITYTDHNGGVNFPVPALIGDHQVVNAGNAIAAATLLEDFDIKGEDIAAGLVNATWLGRLEQITDYNLPEGWELWFDGGHNEAAGYSITQMVERDWDDMPLYIICGTTRGKDVTAFLRPLLGRAELVCGVSVKSEYNSYSAEQIAKMAMGAGFNSKSCIDIEDATGYITSTSTTPSRILIFGSLFLRIEVGF